MKKYVLIVAMLFSGMTFAQGNKPKLEVVDGLVKATYYYDNGKVEQEGFFKNGKLTGEWTSYDLAGNKKAIGTYENGQKVGKWMFWSGKEVAEVDFSDSKITDFKTTKKNAVVNKY